jgi:hypothetical protein
MRQMNLEGENFMAKWKTLLEVMLFDVAATIERYEQEGWTFVQVWHDTEHTANLLFKQCDWELTPKKGKKNAV